MAYASRATTTDWALKVTARTIEWIHSSSEVSGDPISMTQENGSWIAHTTLQNENTSRTIAPFLYLSIYSANIDTAFLAGQVYLSAEEEADVSMKTNLSLEVGEYQVDLYQSDG